jgi:hypothetical protein
MPAVCNAKPSPRPSGILAAGDPTSEVPLGSRSRAHFPDNGAATPRPERRRRPHPDGSQPGSAAWSTRHRNPGPRRAPAVTTSAQNSQVKLPSRHERGSRNRMEPGSNLTFQPRTSTMTPGANGLHLPAIVPWFERTERWGTTMALARDSPSIQGMSPAQTPPGSLARRLPGGFAGRGSRRRLPCQPRSATRSAIAPASESCPIHLGPHAIGTERSPTVPSGTSFAQVIHAILENRPGWRTLIRTSSLVRPECAPKLAVRPSRPEGRRMLGWTAGARRVAGVTGPECPRVSAWDVADRTGIHPPSRCPSGHEERPEWTARGDRSLPGPW